MTGFHRSLRGVESKVDDSFTVILQYSGEKNERGGKGNLLVTVKTSVVTTMKQPLKHFIRGYDGTWIKVCNLFDSTFRASVNTIHTSSARTDKSHSSAALECNQQILNLVSRMRLRTAN